MKYYSHTARSTRNTTAVSLKDIRSVTIDEGTGRSYVRYRVVIQYTDTTVETFYGLEDDEAKKVYKEILNLLNET